MAWKIPVTLISTLFLLSAAGRSEGVESWRHIHRPDSMMERAVVEEINQARADPRGYAEKLRDGPDSLDPDEAVDFLERQRPVPLLTYDTRLGVSAARHAADQGPLGQDRHVGSDGSRAIQRMQAAGVWSSVYAEVISIGEMSPTGVVRQLIIDYGHPDHPHRADLFDPMLRFAGAGCGPNARYGTMCVIDLTAPPPPR